MAKLPPMSRHADAVHQAVAEGRRADAVDYAIEHLRRGESHSLFLNAVADLLEPKPVGKKGRPKLRMPTFWYEIGFEFDDLRSRGVTAEQACLDLAARYPIGGEKTIARRVRFYQDALAAADAESARDQEADN